MKIYDISLITPLGKKKGELKAEIENGKLTDFFSLLGHTEPIVGTVDENDHCSLKGKFVTLINTIHFTADGTINYDTMQLTIKGESSTYEMVGVLRKKEECDSL